MELNQKIVLGIGIFIVIIVAFFISSMLPQYGETTIDGETICGEYACWTLGCELYSGNRTFVAVSNIEKVEGCD